MLQAYKRSVIRRVEADAVANCPPDALMKKAAGAVADTALSLVSAGCENLAGVKILGLVGSGNNGGDCLYALRYLAINGCQCVALLLGGSVHERALTAALRARVHIIDCRDKDLRNICRRVRTLGLRCSIWLDGMLGTGVRGKLREPYASVVMELNSIRKLGKSAAKVVAIDVPTGITTDDGSVRGDVLYADVTVSMGAVKQAALLPPGATLWGRLEVVDLGLKLPEPGVSQLELDDICSFLRPPNEYDHKYTRGVVQVVAGSEQYPNTAVLCAGGAARSGAGMVRVQCPDEGRVVCSLAWPEVVFTAGQFQALLAGPGVDPADSGQCRKLIDLTVQAVNQGAPVVLDAGALEQYVDILGACRLQQFNERVVLTPHAGEAARLLTLLGAGVSQGGISRSQVEAAPAKWGSRLAEVTGAVVILKGSVTLICAPSGQIFTVPVGMPWAATAGSGDVLAGVLASFLAQSQADVQRRGKVLSVDDMVFVAGAAVWVHAAAASWASAQRELGPIVASDLVEALPSVLGRVFGAKFTAGSNGNRMGFITDIIMDNAYLRALRAGGKPTIRRRRGRW